MRHRRRSVERCRRSIESKSKILSNRTYRKRIMVARVSGIQQHLKQVATFGVSRIRRDLHQLYVKGAYWNAKCHIMKRLWTREQGLSHTWFISRIFKLGLNLLVSSLWVLEGCQWNTLLNDWPTNACGPCHILRRISRCVHSRWVFVLWCHAIITWEPLWNNYDILQAFPSTLSY